MQVISADIGNITSIFTSNTGTFICESRFEPFQDNDLIENEVFEYQGQKLVANAGEFENAVFKYQKENFLKLLNYGVCKVAKDYYVNLVVGIPAGQYEKHKDALRNHIMDHNELEIKIDKEVKRVVINDVMVIPEGYGIYKTTSKDKLESKVYTLTIDIGGGTTDLSLYNYQGQLLEVKSIKRGLLNLYALVRDGLSDFGITSITDAMNYFDDKLKLLGVDDSYKKIPHKTTFNAIMNDIKGIYPSVAQYNVILCGGGGRIFGNDFVNWLPQTIVETDITLGSKSGKLIGDVKFG